MQFLHVTWDPNLSLFCNEIPLLNGTDLTQILWDPSWKKKEDLTSISEKVNICYTFDEKKVNNNFFGFLANFDHLEEMSQISKNLVNFRYFQPFLHCYSKTFFQHLRNFGSFFQVLPKMAKINKKSLVNPMIFKFLSLEMFILGQKASKTTFHKKYSI